MAFCSNCGADIGNAKFCPNCGAPAPVQAVPDPAAVQKAAEEQAAAQKAAEEQAAAQKAAEEQAAAQKQAAAQQAAAAQPGMHQTPPQVSPQHAHRPAGGGMLNINGPAKILLIVCGVFAALGIILSLVLGKSSGVSAGGGLLGGLGGGKLNNPAVGNWIGKSVEMSGMTLGMEAIGDMSINLKDNGSCEFTMDGKSTTGKWSFADNTVTIQDSDVASALGSGSGDEAITATLDGDTLTMEDLLGSGMTIVLAREGSAAASAAVSTDLSGADTGAGMAESSDAEPADSNGAAGNMGEQAECEEFNGDWYGVLDMSNATGDYEYMDGMTYAVMRVSMDPDNTGDMGDVFLSAWLSDPACDFQLNGMFGNSGQLLLSGTLWGETLDDMTFEKDPDYSDGSMYSFTTALNNDSGSATMKFYLEKWNEPWTGKDSLAFTDDDTNFFKGQNIRDIIDSGFGLDSSMLPSEMSVGMYSTNEGPAGMAESTDASGTEPDDSGESVSFATPSLAAFPKADLKKIYDKLQNVPEGTSYDDIRDSYFDGVDGQVLYSQDDITQYWWGSTEDPATTGIIVMINTSDNTFSGLATQWNLE